MRNVHRIYKNKCILWKHISDLQIIRAITIEGTTWNDVTTVRDHILDGLGRMGLDWERHEALEHRGTDETAETSRIALATEALTLDRGSNWQIHEHAYMGMREDMYAASGRAPFVLDTTRERVPSESTHRYQIG